jgi:hypothetical protein
MKARKTHALLQRHKFMPLYSVIIIIIIIAIIIIIIITITFRASTCSKTEFIAEANLTD